MLFRSQKASTLSSAPHVLDTLAESYYANGRFEEAVRIGLRAVAAAAEDRAYVEGQVQKFREAAGKG